MSRCNEFELNFTELFKKELRGSKSKKRIQVHKIYNFLMRLIQNICDKNDDKYRKIKADKPKI